MTLKIKPVPGDRRDQRKDFRREDGQDEFVQKLDDARSAFQNAMVVETALLADSMNPEWRSAGRKILGIGNTELEPDEETHIRTMKKVISGEHYAMFALAREMLEDDDVDGRMKVLAGALVGMHSIVALKRHAIEPTHGAGEEELLVILTDLAPQIALAMADDLRLICRKSPYEDVRSAARAILDQIE